MFALALDHRVMVGFACLLALAVGAVVLRAQMRRVALRRQGQEAAAAARSIRLLWQRPGFPRERRQAGATWLDRWKRPNKRRDP